MSGNGVIVKRCGAWMRLDFTRDERLHALWWLIALRGLRRGEAAGLRSSDLDLDRGHLEIVRQRTTAGHQVIQCAPKSAASARLVAVTMRPRWRPVLRGLD